MRSGIAIWMGAVTFLLGTGTPAARATIVTFGFGGNITFVLDNQGRLGGGVSVGDAFSGTYSFDSTTPDAAPGDSALGTYDDAILSVAGQAGSLLFEGPAAGLNYIQVQDNLLGAPSDVYVARTEVDVEQLLLDFSLGLLDPTGAAFSNDLLPLEPPPLELFSATFHLQSETLGINVAGQVTSLTLVPEPGTAVLLGFATSSVAARRRFASCVTRCRWAMLNTSNGGVR